MTFIFASTNTEEKMIATTKISEINAMISLFIPFLRLSLLSLPVYSLTTPL